MWKMYKLKLPNKPSLDNQWFGILVCRTGTDLYRPQILCYGLTSKKSIDTSYIITFVC